MLQSQIKILCKAKIAKISLQRLSHEQQQQAAKEEKIDYRQWHRRVKASLLVSRSGLMLWRYQTLS